MCPSELTRNPWRKSYNEEERAFAVHRTFDGDHG